MNTPVHVAITRTVRPGCEEAFEEAIRSFFAGSLSDKATLGAQLLRPLPGSNTRTYGILRSFANENERDAFGFENLFVVAALTWVVMPLLTRLARPWLK